MLHTIRTSKPNRCFNYLQQSQFVWPTNVRVLVPAAVRILNATEAAVVATIAHGQIDLLDAMVRGNIQWLAVLADLHHLDRLVYGHLEDVQQLRERLVVTIVLDDLVNATEIRADIEYGVLLVEQVDFNSERFKLWVIWPEKNTTY